MNETRPGTGTGWHQPGTFNEQDAPGSDWRDWLLDAGSLTERLRARFGERLTLVLLERGYQAARSDEAGALDLDPGEEVLLRRVMLTVDGTPVIQARAVIPKATLQGDGERLAKLEDRPLGEVAFSELGARREKLMIGRLSSGNELFPELEEAAWARRSVLVSRTGPVLVTETFLPALLEALEQ